MSFLLCAVFLGVCALGLLLCVFFFLAHPFVLCLRWSTAAGAAFLVLPPMRLRARLSSAEKAETPSQRCLVSSRRALALASLLCCRSSSAFLVRQFKLVPFEPILQSCVHRSAICVAGDRTVRPGAWRWDVPSGPSGRYSSASTASRLWTAAAGQGSDSKKEKVRTTTCIIIFFHAFVILDSHSLVRRRVAFQSVSESRLPYF